MFLSICVVMTLMFQSVHTYSHLITDYFDAASHHDKNAKALAHHGDDCQICHFTLSPFTDVSLETIVFYSLGFYPKTSAFHQFDLIDVSFDLITLRGPPDYI